MRALLCVRLSRLTDETTSPERQLVKCRELCEQRGWEVVGLAEDLDVAGSTSPFERPQLGDWLKNRPQDFDAIVFFRVDRIVRRLFDLADLIRWARDHSVTLVSATESYFDLSTEFGDILALLVAKVAEMELAAISERNASAAQHNIKAGKYRGGVPPWGYLPQLDEAGDWRFVQDPDQVNVINEVVRRVLDGEPLRALAHELTERKVLTPRDRFAQSKGREIVGHAWHSSPLKRALRSPALLGQVVTREPLLDANGRPVKDAKGKKKFGPETVVRSVDGSPVVRSEPILTREIFDRVGKELAERENRKEPTKRSNGLLLRVAYCAVCGAPAYKLKGGQGRADRYRCKSASDATPCGGRSIKMDLADSLVEAAVLAYLGDSFRLERVWDSGSDNSAELAEIETQLLDMTDAIGSPGFRRGSPQREKLLTTMDELEARRQWLAAQAVKKPGWEWKPTDEKFADWWNHQDVSGRNIWLRSNDIRFEFNGEKRAHLGMGALDELLKQLAPGPTATKWQESFAEMGEAGIAGYEFFSDDLVRVHMSDGREFLMDLKPHELTPEEEARAAEFYGWDKEEKPDGS